MSRTAWGKARLQVYALKPELLTLLKKGENLEGAYQKLCAEHGLTAAKRTFKRHAKIIRENALSEDFTPLARTPENSSPSKAPAVGSSPEPKPENNIPAPQQTRTSKPVVNSTLKRGGYDHRSDGAGEAVAAAYGSVKSHPDTEESEA